MKKIILLLATCILSTHAITCMDLLSVRFYYFLDDGYKIDSIKTYNESSDGYSSEYSKFQYNDSALESMSDCNDENCQIHYTYKHGYDNIQNTRILEEFWEGKLLATATLYVDNDSIYSLLDDDGYLSVLTLVRRNDTLFEEIYDGKVGETLKLDSKTFLITDPLDSNKCYAYDQDGKIIEDSGFETETVGSLLTMKAINNGSYETIYYSRTDEGTTRILRKFHPTTISKQYQFFDLKGRPAKNKNIMKVVK